MEKFERGFNPEGIRESIRTQNYAIDGHTQAVSVDLLEDIAKEFERCYAEIERQRALIERAVELFEHTELCTDEMCKNYQCADYKQWLKDASGEVKGGKT